MAREELDACQARQPELEEHIKLLLVPADPQDSKNAILEIRGGTGGDEAAIFAGDLFRMYTKYCETKGWRMEISSVNEGAAGGFKEVICSVTGDNVYGTLKYESGVHRVQRVPATETQGRVHTSAASVAVLPEAEEFDVVINEGEIKWDTFRSGGAGGQNVYSIFKLLSCAFFNFFCLLFYLKKPASSGKSIFLKRRSNCKTYCFGCSRFISYNEISGKRV